MLYHTSVKANPVDDPDPEEDDDFTESEEAEIIKGFEEDEREEAANASGKPEGTGQKTEGEKNSENSKTVA